MSKLKKQLILINSIFVITIFLLPYIYFLGSYQKKFVKFLKGDIVVIESGVVYYVYEFENVDRVTNMFPINKWIPFPRILHETSVIFENSYQYTSKVIIVAVPIPLFFAGLGLASYVLFRGKVVRSLRLRNHLCIDCGYSLRGLETPCCPECGKESGRSGLDLKLHARDNY